MGDLPDLKYLLKSIDDDNYDFVFESTEIWTEKINMKEKIKPFKIIK